jgi:hypothetical protein
LTSATGLEPSDHREGGNNLLSLVSRTLLRFATTPGPTTPVPMHDCPIDMSGDSA